MINHSSAIIFVTGDFFQKIIFDLLANSRFFSPGIIFQVTNLKIIF